MCGIFLVQTNNNRAEEIVFAGLKKLEYRGYDSFGIFSLGIDGGININKFVGKVSDAKISVVDSNFAMGHTRWATHGGVTKENSHPHISNNRNLVIVHNGIFENYLEYKKILEKNKYNFVSETDTEVLVNLLEYEMKKNKAKLFPTVKKVLKNIKGSNSFIVYDIENKETIAARNGSALHAGKSSDSIYLSSDSLAILEKTNQIYSLKDGEVIALSNIDKLKFKKVETKTEQEDKKEYEHFTLKEIFDQKKTIKLAYDKNITLEKSLGANWYKNKNIFSSGCGTAYNAAMVFANLAAGSGINMRAIPANEQEVLHNLLDKNTILFLFSQSGETADSIIFAKKVLERGGKVYSILNSEFSTLCELSTKTFLIHSGKEVAVASTKAFTGMVLTSLKLLGHPAGSKKDFEKLDTFINSKLVEDIKNITLKYKNIQNLFVIGKGFDNIVALETALKIKETSYIHAEGFAAGELKHGVLALVEKGVLCILLNSSKKYENDMQNAGLQIKARGGEVLGIGLENMDYYDSFVKIDDTKLSNIYSIIVGQILGYQFSVTRGFSPDKPRNLAKSVTVK